MNCVPLRIIVSAFCLSFFLPASSRADASTNGFALDEFLLAPLRIHLLQDTNAPPVHTTLTDSDIGRILGKMNRIWSQAGIHFYLESLLREKAVNGKDYDPKKRAGRDTLLPLRPQESLSRETFHVYYVKQLRPNGIFLGPASFVKDTARLRKAEGGIDEPLPRVSSHELGHALGLGHRQNITNLMASGMTGCWLNSEEIETTRDRASKISWVSKANEVLQQAETLYASAQSEKAAPLYARLAEVPLNDKRITLARERRVPINRRDGPIAPAEAEQSIYIEKGMKVELVAAEPLVKDPVAFAFDDHGRMFVAENSGYPVGPNKGAVAMLEDTNGDGRMDKRTVFAPDLEYPNGLMCWRGGIFVTCAPDLFYLKDTNGDGKADVRKVVLTGYMTNSTTQLRMAHPTLGLDGWVYVTSGLTGGQLTSPEYPDRKPVTFKKSDSRFDPDDYRVEEYPGAGQFGLCFDDFGHKFTVSNRNPLQHVVVHPDYWSRNPNYAFSKFVQDVSPHGDDGKVWPVSKDMTTASFMPRLMSTPHAGSFTSACGISMYNGDLIPAYQGSSFTCEPAQNLVQRQVVSRDGPTFKSRPATIGRDFMASADTWFRPVFSGNGPDGAVYVCDMYRKIVDHPRYLPEYIRDTLDFESGKGMGRIYRIVPAEAKVRRKTAPLPATQTAKLVAEMNSANGWRRDVAFRLLLEKNDKSVSKELRKLCRRDDSPPAARLKALYVLRHLGVLEEGDVENAMADASAGVREHAVQMAEVWMDRPEFVNRVAGMSVDDDPGVRFRAALALGGSPSDRALEGMIEVAVIDAKNEYSRAAVFSGLKGRSDAFQKQFKALPADVTLVAPLYRDLGRLTAAERKPAEVAAGILRIQPNTRSNSELEIAWLTGAGKMLSAKRFKGKSPSVLANLANVGGETNTNLKQIERLLKVAETIAGDSKLDAEKRVAALEFLSLGEPAQAGPFLMRLLNSKEPTAFQVQVVNLLSGALTPAIASELLSATRWHSYMPGVRTGVMELLAANSGYWKTIYGAIEQGIVPAWAVPERRRRNMLATKNKELNELAKKAFASLQSGDRNKVYEEFKSVLKLKADGGSGKAVFERTCAACHRFDGIGFAVGPDLSGVRNQPSEALLLHLIMPNAEIYPGFMAYEVETKDDRSLTGILVSETPTSLTIRAAQGIESTILRSNIAELRSSNISLMPQELEKTMTKQELANLLGFLRGE